MELIVVGVDGSEGAEAALDFASGEADLRKARLRIVTAWELPPELYGGAYGIPYGAAIDPETREIFAERADKLAQTAVASVKQTHPAVECEGQAVEGQPAEVLLGEAARADLIVVGNRGRGGFKSLLLGSVSQHVVHHAECPVVVVRATAAAAPDED